MVSFIDATVRNCINSLVHLTTIKEVGSEEIKYCRHLGVKGLLIEQSETKTMMQIWVVLENKGMLLWTLARTEELFVIEHM